MDIVLRWYKSMKSDAWKTVSKVKRQKVVWALTELTIVSIGMFGLVKGLKIHC